MGYQVAEGRAQDFSSHWLFHNATSVQINVIHVVVILFKLPYKQKVSSLVNKI